MIRLCLVLWVVFVFSACGDYFNEEIQTKPPGTTDEGTEDPSNENEGGKSISANTTFAGVYGGDGNDEAVSVVPTDDNGYMVAGNTRSFGAGDKDIIVMKLDQYGNIAWQKTYGGEKDDMVRSMIKHGNGYTILGETESFGKGDVDLWVIKINSLGNIMWEKTYGGTSTEKAGGLQALESGSLVIAANTISPEYGTFDMWLMRLSALGEIEMSEVEGGAITIISEGIIINSINEYLIYGHTNQLTSAYSGYFHNVGDYFGLNDCAYVCGPRDFYVRSVCQTPDGDYLAVLQITGVPSLSHTLLLIKFNNRIGTMLWKKSIYGTGSSYGKIAIRVSDESFIIGGSTSAYGEGDYDFWMIELDYDGNILKQKTIGSTDTDYLHGLSPNGKGGYILSGYTTSFGVATQDMLITNINLNDEIEDTTIVISDSNAVWEDFTAVFKSTEFESQTYQNTLQSMDSKAIVTIPKLRQRFY